MKPFYADFLFFLSFWIPLPSEKYISLNKELLMRDLLVRNYFQIVKNVFSMLNYYDYDNPFNTPGCKSPY